MNFCEDVSQLGLRREDGLFNLSPRFWSISNLVVIDGTEVRTIVSLASCSYASCDPCAYGVLFNITWVLSIITWTLLSACKRMQMSMDMMLLAWGWPYVPSRSVENLKYTVRWPYTVGYSTVMFFRICRSDAWCVSPSVVLKPCLTTGSQAFEKHIWNTKRAEARRVVQRYWRLHGNAVVLVVTSIDRMLQPNC